MLAGEGHLGYIELSSALKTLVSGSKVGARSRMRVGGDVRPGEINGALRFK